jgi:hypothetical protein
MPREFYGSRTVLWFRRTLSFVARSWTRLHYSRNYIHPGTNKMYHDLRKNLWWTRMKREIAKYVSECDTYRRVKADHLRPAGNLQPLSIIEWKWEDICMDFIVGLPCTSHGYNSIWAIIDCLTRSAHFIPLSTTYRVRQYAELYISHIVHYHGIPKTIISDRGSRFVARFWEQLHECLGTHLIRSSAYHSQTDGMSQSNH